MSEASNTINTFSNVSTAAHHVRQVYAETDRLFDQRLTIADEIRTEPKMRRLMNRRIKAVAKAAATKPKTLGEAAEMATVALMLLDQSGGISDPQWDEINVALQVCSYLANRELRT